MTDVFGFAGKTVVVTGASSGIGASVADHLATAGATVVGIGSRELSPRYDYVRVDLTSRDDIAEKVDLLPDRIDVLINAAGAVPMASKETILAVNFLGARELTTRLLDRFQLGGAIVNVSSDGGYGWRKNHRLTTEFLSLTDWEQATGWYDQHADDVGHPYSFTKEALNLWGAMQAVALAPRGIRVNTVSPGAVQTPMLEAIEASYTAAAITPVEFPSGRRSTPEEQAWPILFLASPLASYINGADLAVDGGFWASLNVHGTLW